MSFRFSQFCGPLIQRQAYSFELSGLSGFQFSQLLGLWMLGPGCKSRPAGVNEHSFYAKPPSPSVNYSQWSARSDKIWSARCRLNIKSAETFADKSFWSPIMKELRGGGGVETMNAYAPLDCLPTTLRTEFQIASPTPASTPQPQIDSISDHECREASF